MRQLQLGVGLVHGVPTPHSNMDIFSIRKKEGGLSVEIQDGGSSIFLSGGYFRVSVAVMLPFGNYVTRLKSLTCVTLFTLYICL